jgi:hypothetical protein
MRLKSFRLCMLIGAAALGAVALYYFIRYAVVLDVALDNSGVHVGLQASIRALWLAFAFQALLIGSLYALVAFRPRAVSREVIVLFGLLQLVEAILLFTFAGSRVMALLLVAVAACVMIGALLWPSAQHLAAAVGSADPAVRPAPPAPR